MCLSGQIGWVVLRRLLTVIGLMVASICVLSVRNNSALASMIDPPQEADLPDLTHDQQLVVDAQLKLEAELSMLKPRQRFMVEFMIKFLNPDHLTSLGYQSAVDLRSIVTAAAIYPGALHVTGSHEAALIIAVASGLYNSGSYRLARSVLIKKAKVGVLSETTPFDIVTDSSKNITQRTLAERLEQVLVNFRDARPPHISSATLSAIGQERLEQVLVNFRDASPPHVSSATLGALGRDALTRLGYAKEQMDDIAFEQLPAALDRFHQFAKHQFQRASAWPGSQYARARSIVRKHTWLRVQ